MTSRLFISVSENRQLNVSIVQHAETKNDNRVVQSGMTESTHAGRSLMVYSSILCGNEKVFLGSNSRLRICSR
jgi:hypothetical protein